MDSTKVSDMRCHLSPATHQLKGTKIMTPVQSSVKAKEPTLL